MLRSGPLWLQALIGRSISIYRAPTSRPLRRRAGKQMHHARNVAGPSSLVTRPQPCPVVAVEAIIEQDEISPSVMPSVSRSSAYRADSEVLEGSRSGRARVCRVARRNRVSRRVHRFGSRKRWSSSTRSGISHRPAYGRPAPCRSHRRTIEGRREGSRGALWQVETLNEESRSLAAPETGSRTSGLPTPPSGRPSCARRDVCRAVATNVNSGVARHCGINREERGWLQGLATAIICSLAAARLIDSNRLAPD